jgi:hypothetical protein
VARYVMPTRQTKPGVRNYAERVGSRSCNDMIVKTLEKAKKNEPCTEKHANPGGFCTARAGNSS